MNTDITTKQADALAALAALAATAIRTDLTNQIAHLKWRIRTEMGSFSHLDMAHNVLPIIGNLELETKRLAASCKAITQQYEEANAHRYDLAGRLNEVLLTKGVQECLDAATKSGQSSS